MATEALESRVLLTTIGVTNSGVLAITGTNFGERVTVTYGQSANGTLFDRIKVTSEQAGGGLSQAVSFDITRINEVRFRGLGGDDTFLISVPLRTVADGGAGNDILISSRGPFGTGGSGNDVFVGGDGNDLLVGGDGDDLLLGGAGNDRLYGGSLDGDPTTADGNDTLDGGTGDDLLVGGGGDDTLFGRAGADVLLGGDGNDVLFGGTGVDRLSGGEGNDRLFGEDDDDRLDGGAGDDLLEGGDGDDSLSGGAGEDILRGGVGNDLLDGGADDDILQGGIGNDRLIGGTGNDRLNGGDGNDVLDGGDGNDILSGGEGDDILRGRAGIDLLLGENGDDRLFGGDGNDRLLGGLGNDLLDGGVGDDLLDGDDRSRPAFGGNDRLIGGTGNDLLFGGAGDDLLEGGAGDDRLFGGFGADRLFGGAGDDYLYGGDAADNTARGRDVLEGGAGRDLFLIAAIDLARDATVEDAVAQFLRGDRDWTDAAVESTGNALDLMKTRTGGVRILTDPIFPQNPLTFRLWGAIPGVESQTNLLNRRTTRGRFLDVRDRTGGVSFPTAVALLAKNWDQPDELNVVNSSRFLETRFLPISGWTRTQQPGLIRSGDGNWFYRSQSATGSDFYRSRVTSATFNPFEDYAATWEGYFTGQRDIGEYRAGRYTTDFTLDRKYAELDALFSRFENP